MYVCTYASMYVRMYMFLQLVSILYVLAPDFHACLCMYVGTNVCMYIRMYTHSSDLTYMVYVRMYYVDIPTPFLHMHTYMYMCVNSMHLSAVSIEDAFS